MIKDMITKCDFKNEPIRKRFIHSVACMIKHRPKYRIFTKYMEAACHHDISTIPLLFPLKLKDYAYIETNKALMNNDVASRINIVRSVEEFLYKIPFAKMERNNVRDMRFTISDYQINEKDKDKIFVDIEFLQEYLDMSLKACNLDQYFTLGRFVNNFIKIVEGKVPIERYTLMRTMTDEIKSVKLDDDDYLEMLFSKNKDLS